MIYIITILLFIICFIKAEKITDASVKFWKNYPILRYLPSKCFEIRSSVFRFFIVCMIIICLLLFLNSISSNILLLHD
jgi:hypothetical protein